MIAVDVAVVIVVVGGGGGGVVAALHDPTPKDNISGF